MVITIEVTASKKPNADYRDREWVSVPVYVTEETDIRLLSSEELEMLAQLCKGMANTVSAKLTAKMNEEKENAS